MIDKRNFNFKGWYSINYRILIDNKSLVKLNKHTHIKIQMPELDIAVADNVIQVFRDMKMKNIYRYAVFAIKENVIEIETLGGADASHQEFLEKLLKDECRYATLNMNFELPSGDNGVKEGERSKTVFVAWVPHNSNAKSRFVYTAAKIPFKRKLGGLNLDICAAEYDDLTEGKVLSKCIAACK